MRSGSPVARVEVSRDRTRDERSSGLRQLRRPLPAGFTFRPDEAAHER